MGDIRQCFFTDDMDDKLSLVQSLLENPHCMYTRMELMSKDDRWLRSRICTYIIDNERIKTNLQEVMTTYKDFTEVT
jgi:hypothetical protein